MNDEGGNKQTVGVVRGMRTSYPVRPWIGSDRQLPRLPAPKQPLEGSTASYCSYGAIVRDATATNRDFFRLQCLAHWPSISGLAEAARPLGCRFCHFWDRERT